MPRDTNGTYTKPAGTTAVTGQIISSSSYNSLANDEADALTDSLSRSGKGGMQAILDMGGKRIVNLGDATSTNSDALTRGQGLIFARTCYFGGTSTGSANAQRIALTPTLVVMTEGLLLTFKAGFTNTGAATLNVDDIGSPLPLRRPDGGDLLAGDIVANADFAVICRPTTSTATLLNPRNAGLGTAADRNVGTGSGNLPEVVDGAGNLNAALNIAHKTLDNLTGGGIQRTAWASIHFNGAGTPFAAFNSCTVVRNGVGLYTIGFPNIGTLGYHVCPIMDVVPDTTGTNCNVVSGTRSVTSVQIACRKGNSSVDPFDPDAISVLITKIG